MSRCEDEKMWRWADVKMRRCEDEQMWRWEDVKMRRCEDEKMWRWADVKMRRCEDEQMWRWEGEDEQMWRWEDVKMRRCEDEKVWRWEDEIQTPTIGRTLRSDALGKNIVNHSASSQYFFVEWSRHQNQHLLTYRTTTCPINHSCSIQRTGSCGLQPTERAPGPPSDHKSSQIYYNASTEGNFENRTDIRRFTWQLPQETDLFSRMRSKGSRFTLRFGGWGCVRSTLRSRSQMSATVVRNRSRPSARLLYGRVYGKFCRRVLFVGFKRLVASFCVAFRRVL